MEVLRLVQNNDASIQFLMEFFSDKEIKESLPDGDRTLAALYRSAQALDNGFVLAYAPVVNGTPIGLFWGKFLNDNCVYGHWGILRKHRHRRTARVACDLVLQRLKEDYPAVTSIMGTVSKSNLRSYAGAIACGFEPMGILPKNHIHNGKVYDSHILVKEI